MCPWPKILLGWAEDVRESNEVVEGKERHIFFKLITYERRGEGRRGGGRRDAAAWGRAQGGAGAG